MKQKLYREMGLIYKSLEIWPEAIKCFRETVKLAELNGIDEKDAYQLLGVSEHNAGHYQDAVKSFTTLIKRDPKLPGGYIQRGRVYVSVGNYKQAILDFSKAIDIVPTNSNSYLYRAEAYIMLDQNEKGTNDLRISARLGNKDAQQTLKDNNLDW